MKDTLTEDCHLEPDQKWGRSYLEATRNALMAAPAEAVASPTAEPNAPSRFKHFYWRISESLSGMRTIIVTLLWHLKHRLPPR